MANVQVEDRRSSAFFELLNKTILDGLTGKDVPPETVRQALKTQPLYTVLTEEEQCRITDYVWRSLQSVLKEQVTQKLRDNLPLEKFFGEPDATVSVSLRVTVDIPVLDIMCAVQSSNSFGVGDSSRKLIIRRHDGAEGI